MGRSGARRQSTLHPECGPAAPRGPPPPPSPRILRRRRTENDPLNTRRHRDLLPEKLTPELHRSKSRPSEGVVRGVFVTKAFRQGQALRHTARTATERLRLLCFKAPGAPRQHSPTFGRCTHLGRPTPAVHGCHVPGEELLPDNPHPLPLPRHSVASGERHFLDSFLSDEANFFQPLTPPAPLKRLKKKWSWFESGPLKCLPACTGSHRRGAQRGPRRGDQVECAGESRERGSSGWHYPAPPFGTPRCPSKHHSSNFHTNTQFKI